MANPIKRINEIKETSRKLGVEAFDTELFKEIRKLDSTKDYKPSDFMFAVRRAKSRALQKLKEVK